MYGDARDNLTIHSVAGSPLATTTEPSRYEVLYLGDRDRIDDVCEDACATVVAYFCFEGCARRRELMHLAKRGKTHVLRNRRPHSISADYLALVVDSFRTRNALDAHRPVALRLHLVYSAVKPHNFAVLKSKWITEIWRTIMPFDGTT